MAKTAANYTYTDQELLDIYREMLADLKLGKEYWIGNRKWVSSDIPEVLQAIRDLEQRVNAAAQTAPAEFSVRMLRRGGRD